MSKVTFRGYRKVDLTEFHKKFGELLVEPEGKGYTTPCGRLWIGRVSKTKWAVKQGPKPRAKDFQPVIDSPLFYRMRDALMWIGESVYE